MRTTTSSTTQSGVDAFIDPIANDTDPDGNALIGIVTAANQAAAHGNVRTDPINHRLIYTPNPGYVGDDTFSYTAAELGQSGKPGFADTTVHVSVTAPPGFGSVQANVAFEGGGLVVGDRACFELTGPSGPAAPAQCVTAADPSLVFPNVPLGSYSIALQYVRTRGGALVPSLPAAFVVPAAVPVDVTHDGTTAVSVDVKTRKLAIGAVTPDGSAQGPFCYHLAPVAALAAPTLDACTFPVFGAPLAVFGTDVWGGVAYLVSITSHPVGLHVPPDDSIVVGPFDDTTELNPLILHTVPVGSLDVHVAFENGRSPGPSDASALCARLEQGGVDVLRDSAFCVRTDGTFTIPLLPVGDYDLVFGPGSHGAPPEYVLPAEHDRLSRAGKHDRDHGRRALPQGCDHHGERLQGQRADARVLLLVVPGE